MKTSSATAPFKQRSGLEPLAALSLAGVILFLLISGAIAYFNLQTLRDDNQKTIHSHEVMATLDDLLSAAQDAETGQRGFLLTNNDKYLEPYNTAVTTVGSAIDRIALLTQDNPTQQARIPSLKAHVAAKLAELKQTIELRRTQGADAALAVVNTDRGKVEMDAIRTELAAMDKEEANLREQRVAERNNAYGTALASAVVSALLGISLTGVVGVLYRRAAIARQREEWLRSGHLGLGAAVQGDQRVDELGDSVLGFLARYLGAVAGAIFIRDDAHYRRASTYGVPAEANIPERFAPREGLLGQAAAESRAITIADLPEGYLTFASALGQDKPRHLVISPGAVDGTVNAVVELGFLHAVDASTLTLLEQTSTPIAIAVRTANFRSELQKLLEDTQRQAEELQVQGEELRVSNEELEEQGRALKESHARLEQQQVELEQTNAQLEEQTRQLETQRDDLEHANAAVQLKARELGQASQFKSDFLANMSHELRTPLNSSLILAKLLADNPYDNLTEEQVKYAQTIQSSGNDLLNLINDILDLSKIEAGHVEILAEPASLESLANDLRRLFQPIAQEKGLGFTAEIAPGCPATVTTDSQRLEQVLKNLLSNAFKFTETGQVGLTAARSANGQIAFSVTDTGIGIPEDQQQSVFEAFRQADGTISRRYGGTGLGLSICRELIRLLGGSIHLKSHPGQGSTFTVVIPEIYDPARVVPRGTRPSTPVIAVNPPAVSISIAVPAAPSRKVADDRDEAADDRHLLLIIEDDEAFASILRDLSREMGFRSLVAGTAEEALNLAQQFRPSAIVLDIGLPDESGLTVLDRLKRDVQTRHIPIHVVSAGDHAQTAFSLGAVGYMLKPVKREQLVEVLGKLEAQLSQRMHRVLIVEDDDVQREAVRKLLSSHEVETVTAATAADCLEQLKEQTFDCMVLDLSLPDASGYSLLETLSRESDYSFPPVIVYTGRELSADDEQRLRRYSKSIIIKGAKSPERLLDEVTLFLHQVVSELPAEHQKMIRQAKNRDAILEGRRILVVEDDVRNVYALTNILEPRGALIEIARNGREALDTLVKFTDGASLGVDLVLMDVMMPVMDGLAATREIRANPDWKKLPVITLTAKAMPDDQQRCIEAGANDYMAKPLDVEKLLSLVRVWMPR
jgi:signal transduction histidine kinase/DNA-binding response OmpR family regulator/CHASE3 domain sensor protein